MSYMMYTGAPQQRQPNYSGMAYTNPYSVQAPTAQYSPSPPTSMLTPSPGPGMFTRNPTRSTSVYQANRNPASSNQATTPTMNYAMAYHPQGSFKRVPVQQHNVMPFMQQPAPYEYTAAQPQKTDPYVVQRQPEPYRSETTSSRPKPDINRNVKFHLGLVVAVAILLIILIMAIIIPVVILDDEPDDDDDSDTLPQPTDVALLVSTTIPGSITLDRTFTDDLMDSNSSPYQTLRVEVEDLCDDILENVDEVTDCRVTGFNDGSIVALLEISGSFTASRDNINVDLEETTLEELQALLILDIDQRNNDLRRRVLTALQQEQNSNSEIENVEVDDGVLPFTTRDACTGRNCNNNGDCRLGVCRCNLGFRGDDCEDSDGCAGRSSCSGYGVCDTSVGCICDTGYFGDTCQDCAANYMRQGTACIERNPCAGVTCNNRGTCSNGDCICNSGYEGDSCETETDCVGNTCSNVGTCSGGICTCNTGYQGSSCEHCVLGYTRLSNNQCGVVNPCAGVTCSGRGSCSGGFCTCNTGYQGSACQTCAPGYIGQNNQCVQSGNPCDGISCGSGTCVNGGCMCGPLFTGGNCESPLSLCPSLQCSVNSICVNNQCDCDSGYRGDRCQELDPLCANVLDNCANGRCTNGVCICDDGYAGNMCENTISCTSSDGDNPCRNGGTCEAGGSCECLPGYSGVFCENLLAYCNSDAECNGGWCNPPQDGAPGGRCTCLFGQTGRLCEGNSEAKDCQRCDVYGICERDGQNRLECTCDTGWTGNYCERLSSTCGDCFNGECESGQCVCDDDWEGDSCNVRVAPDACRGITCSGRGTCANGVCTCNTGYDGDNCADCATGFSRQTGTCVRGYEFQTYNVGLLEPNLGGKSLEERKNDVLTALRESTADVIAVQEVFLEEHMREFIAVGQEVGLQYSFSFLHNQNGQIPVDFDTPVNICGDMGAATETWFACVLGNCLSAADLIDYQVCTLTQCSALALLPPRCMQCALQTCFDLIASDPFMTGADCVTTAAGGLCFTQMNNGAQRRTLGLLLLSRYQMSNTEAVHYDYRNNGQQTYTFRGYLKAQIQGIGPVFATHLTTDSAAFIDLYQTSVYETWREMNQDEMTQLLDAANAEEDDSVVILGDLNSGPRIPDDIDGEFADNFRIIAQKGFASALISHGENTAPTFDEDTNSLVPQNYGSVLIDHILVKKGREILDADVLQNSFNSSASQVSSLLSDHYGVYAVVPRSQVQLACRSNDDCCNGGTCNTLGTCNCPPMYSGQFCESTNAICRGQGDCLNGGWCITHPSSNLQQFGGRCSCPFGFSGGFCENEVIDEDCNRCAGTCQRGSDTQPPRCVCQDTTNTGPFCDFPGCGSDQCVWGECSGNTCTCEEQWEGPQCDSRITEFEVMTANAALLRWEMGPAGQAVNRYVRLDRFQRAVYESSADVLCLQEVWFEIDMRGLLDFVQEKYPHSFSALSTASAQLRTDFPAPKNTCGAAVEQITEWNTCVVTNCFSARNDAASYATCVFNSPCNAPVSPRCLECALAACFPAIAFSGDIEAAGACTVLNLQQGLCHSWISDGANITTSGLLILSKYKINSGSYNNFLYTRNRPGESGRGYLTADIENVGQVVCAHLSGQLPIFFEGTATGLTSWEAMNEWETRYLHDTVLPQLGGDAIVMGHMNNGPEIPQQNVYGEFENVYELWSQAEYGSVLDTNQIAPTFASNNFFNVGPLFTVQDALIDNIFINMNEDETDKEVVNAWVLDHLNRYRQGQAAADELPLSDHSFVAAIIRRVLVSGK